MKRRKKKQPEFIWMERTSPAIGHERALVSSHSVGVLERKGWRIKKDFGGVDRAASQ